MERLFSLGLANYYGEVAVYENDGTYYLGLDNYDGTSYEEISEELYNVLDREFNV